MKQFVLLIDKSFIKKEYFSECTKFLFNVGNKYIGISIMVCQKILHRIVAE